MRSPREILFRGRQEIGNALLWKWPPSACLNVSSLSGLDSFLKPDTDIEAIAAKLMQNRFPMLGIEIDAGPQIHWRKDYLHGKETEAHYFRRIPYLNFEAAGDHKIIWELNRHQHLVVLAHAGRPEHLKEIWAQLESWLEQNPFQSGINWASALEVAFRALSWLSVYRLVGSSMPESLKKRFLDSLYQHGWHLEFNLSYYFSRNTHLLGEAVVLHALGVFFADCRRAAKWRSIGAEVVRSELDFQVFEDGAHFEQSTYYHVYALDFFLLHYALAGRPEEYGPVLTKMADYLHALLGSSGHLSFLGDDDGGRLFHPYGDHAKYGQATLVYCSELLGWKPRDFQSRLFKDSGIAVLTSGEHQILFDAGPFGFARGGHSHSDTLSLTVRDGDTEILVDAATYTYISDIEQRNWFRGSAAHNTLRIDDRDQAEPAGPFAWASKPKVRIEAWQSTPEIDFIAAICDYSGITHRRQIRFEKPSRLTIVDEVSAATKVEQFWHFGADVEQISEMRFRIGGKAELTVSAAGVLEKGGRFGWRSRALGQKEEAYALCVTLHPNAPVTLTTTLELSSH